MVIKNFDGDIFDDEFCTPAQAEAMRDLARLRNAKAQEPQPAPLTDSWFASAHSAPGETYVTVLDMEAEFMPADVAHHREINGTTGQESES